MKLSGLHKAGRTALELSSAPRGELLNSLVMWPPSKGRNAFPVALWRKEILTSGRIYPPHAGDAADAVLNGDLMRGCCGVCAADGTGITGCNQARGVWGFPAAAAMIGQGAETCPLAPPGCVRALSYGNQGEVCIGLVQMLQNG